MRYTIAFMVLMAMPGLGAQTDSAKAETGKAQNGKAASSGPCSSASTSGSPQFSINCQGVSEGQGSQWLAILNRIARDQLDPKAVMQKLDEIETASSSPKPAAQIAEPAPRPQSKGEAITYTATYTYEGVLRTTRSGLPATDSKNPAAKAYRKIKRAHEGRQWDQLASLCDQAIDEWPQWLTPVYYKAEAKANLGHMAEAEALLAEVKRRAAGNPEYELLIPEADALLGKIHRTGF